MKRYILFFVFITALSCKSQNDGPTKVIDIDTFKSEVIGKDVQLVDVRTLKEYNAGHIDDAINIDVLDNATFTKEIQNLDKEKPIYIYCQMGGRSNSASQKLKDMGFKTIFDYSGGYGEWSKRN
ncbi:rhodanese-like domain-containing protein [Kriegella aquimaris]|uniref:Rhodanese-related sulfurtransferase n=1 Tax=Kriegella aquimaris TaxID=192904 RepID=A0A1G9JDC0_9FLAO|nr:rhodanese-like domain-containing protein [Kriegella aquimaris]SDL35428.1 Rhodanese-related sulfurtransferase [Kriegella aquimaris]